MEAYIWIAFFIAGMLLWAHGYRQGWKAAKAEPKKYQQYINIDNGEVRDAAGKLITQ